MKIVIDIPDYNLNNIQNGSIACGQILKAVKNGTPYKERPKGQWITENLVEPYGKCNQCGEICEVDNFCGNCGADMRGE